MSWKKDIQWLLDYIDNPDPISRYSAQWHLESIEKILEEMEEKQRQDEEEFNSYCDKLEAELFNVETLAHLQKAAR